MKIILMTKLALSVALCFAFPVADAQTTVAAGSYANMQRAVGGILKSATASRGYLATDPRTYGLLQTAGSVAGGAALAVGTGLFVAGTAPGWASLLVATAAGSVVSFGVNYALNWAVNQSADKPITRTDAINPALAYLSAAQTGAGVWMTYYPQVYAGDPFTAMLGAAKVALGTNGPFQLDSNCVYPTGFDPSKTGQTLNCNLIYNKTNYNYAPQWYPHGAPYAIKAGVAYYNNTELAPVTIASPQTESLASAINALSDQMREDAVSHKQMAAMLNTLWQKSYQASPSTVVPYDAGNPITEQQVKAYADANPNSYPKVKDLLVAAPAAANYMPDMLTSQDPPAQPSGSITLPTDYNREATQAKIAQSLSGSDVPDGTAIDKDVDVNNVDQKNNDAKTLVTGITAESVGLFDWFPRIPTAECVNPSVPDMRGSAHDVPICGAVGTLSKIISAVMAVLAMIASVREIQSALKA